MQFQARWRHSAIMADGAFMNCSNRRRWPRCAPWRFAGIAGGSFVYSDTLSNDPHGAVSTHLTVADLDLANPADVAIARERIHQLARKLCARVEDR
jgi:hypothetical protein